MIPLTVSQAGEDAIRLMSTYTSAGLPITESAAKHAVLGVAGATEAYVDAVLDFLFAEFAENSGRVGVALTDIARKDVDKTWASRLSWLSSFLDVDVRGGPEGQEIQTLIDLRNAIAHGAGGLSPHQKQKGQDGYVKRFSDLFECQIVDQRLVVPVTAPKASVSVGRKFVLWIDVQAVVKSPKLRSARLR